MNCCNNENCRGHTGDRGKKGHKGIIGDPGKMGLTGGTGNEGIKGLTGCPGAVGPVGPDGNDGAVGSKGENGDVGPKGEIGDPGPDGKNGLDGQSGVNGNVGITGMSGASGNTGPSAVVGIESIYMWGSRDQLLRNINRWQYVEFEKPSQGPEGHIWTTTKEVGYDNITTFICGTSGYYLLFFKLDIFAGNSPTSTDISPLECPSGACIVINGSELPGSTSLVLAPEQDHVYSCANQVLVNLRASDKVALMFWSTDNTTSLGNSTIIQGKLPNGSKPTQCCASFTIVRVT